MIRKCLVTVLIFISIIISVGCRGNSPEVSNVFQVPGATDKNIRIKIITSNKKDYSAKQLDVSKKLKTEINSGKYNINSIKTSYSSEYLIAAEIIYDYSSKGKGNNLRIFLIQSDKRDWNEKNSNNQSLLDKTLKNNKYNIAKIQTVRISGYLLAVEVYYWSEE